MKKISDNNLNPAQLLEMIKETRKSIHEGFDRIEKMFEETDRKFKETDKQFKNTDKKLRQLEDLFTGQWGKLVESLVEGNLIKLLKERKIDVQTTAQRVKGKYKNQIFEIDILAKNGRDIVLVEVKTTLKVNHVNEFIEELRIFKKVFPECKNKNVYGAVAFLRSDEESDKFAYKNGLFVIKASAESARILNDKKFQPHKW